MTDRQRNQEGRKRRTSILKATSTINNGRGDDMTMANELNQPTRRVSFNHMPKVKEFEMPSRKYSEKESPLGKSTPSGDAECETPPESPLPSGFVNDTRTLLDTFKPQLGSTPTPAPSPITPGFLDNTQTVFNAFRTNKLRLTSTPALTPTPSAFMDTTKQLFGRLNKLPATSAAIEQSEHESTSSSSCELSVSPACPAFGSPTFNEDMSNTTPRRPEFQDAEEVADAGQTDNQQAIGEDADRTRTVEHSLFEDRLPDSMNPKNKKVQQIMKEGLTQQQRAESPDLHLDLTDTSSSRHSEEHQPKQRQNLISTPEELQDEEEMLDKVAKYGTIGGADRTHVIQHTPYLSRILGNNTMITGSSSKVQLLDDLTHQPGGGSLLFGSQDNSDPFGGGFSGKGPAMALNFDTPSLPQQSVPKPDEFVEDSHTGMGQESQHDESENNDSDDMETAQLPIKAPGMQKKPLVFEDSDSSMETAQLPVAKQLAPVPTAQPLSTSRANFNDITAVIASEHEMSMGMEVVSPPYKLRRPSQAASSTSSQPPPPPSPILPMAHLDDAQFEQWHDAELEQTERAYFAEMERRHEVYKAYYDAEMHKLDIVENVLERMSKFRKEIREAEKRDKDELRAFLSS